MEALDRLGAVLWKRWDASKEDQNIIIGYWYENKTQYEIRVPAQLRDDILYIQNILSYWYCDAYNARAITKKKIDAFNTMLRDTRENIVAKWEENLK